MTFETLSEKTIHIGNLVLEKNLLSKADILAQLPEESGEQFYKLVCDSLRITERVATNSTKKLGGLVRVPKKNSHSRLTSVEDKLIKSRLIELLDGHKQSLERKNTEKPEEAVEKAFKAWLLKEQKKDLNAKEPIINFRSSKRSGEMWENVDGYSIQVEKHKFHLVFRPIVTTYEVKAIFPKTNDLAQAKNYLNFSHHSYLVFKFEGTEDELKQNLGGKGLRYDDHEGVGIYYTNDGSTFRLLFPSKPKNKPSEAEVDKHLERLLDENDKKTLLELRQKYIHENIISPSFSGDFSK